ncbi:hypothetical protein B0H10DRAFT_2242013 [Mycena sp. CBHHK59/15]|nr:hypothetical protein B0H10DRAFT_2242013 [Mycena sp. CBHHK59/15]
MSSTSSEIECSMRMADTIQTLRVRVQELERITAGASQADPGSNNPSGSGSLTSSPFSVRIQEPPPDLISNLVDIFLNRFTNSGYFCLDPRKFRKRALLPLPFGHLERPSPALLSAVYLWGCVLSPITLQHPYTEEAFLICVLQNIPQDLAAFSLNLRLVIETIQAEVLLSYYYLHTARPIQGRYHSAAAASLALSVGLQLLRSPQQYRELHPPFVLVQPLLPTESETTTETERIDAFWSVVILNNYWVAAQGCPPAIPHGITIDAPWPSSARGGATITKFLNGNDQDGVSPAALLAKASILVERIIAFSGRTIGRPDPPAFASLDKRLHSFKTSLPALPGSQLLLLTHALTDVGIVRLHSPYATTSDTARYKCLAACHRIVSGMGAVNLVDAAHNADPMFGPLCATVCSVYIDELLFLRVGEGSPQRRAQYHEIETCLRTLINALATLAPYSPAIRTSPSLI